MQQEVLLAMLAKEPAQGSRLRARLDGALGPLGEAINAGDVYVQPPAGEGRPGRASGERRDTRRPGPEGIRADPGRSGKGDRVAGRGELATA